MNATTVATAERGGQATNRPAETLRIVIPGGEGHLGRLLSRHLNGLGHDVTTLTRDPHGDGDAAWNRVGWDGQNLGEWVGALSGADVLINLVGRSVDCRYNARNRRQILQSRLQSTALLGQAIRGLGRPPRLWLNASTATVYRHSLDRGMDEFTGELGGNEPDAPVSWAFSVEVAKEWEKAFFGVPTPRTRKVAMRAAMVMSLEPDGIFEVLLRLTRMGLGGMWGSGRQYMSWIHEVDFCRSVEFLIEHEGILGAVNLAGPSPVTNDEFLFVLRDAWGIDYGLPLREWMLSVGALLLRTETELLFKSRRAFPGVLLRQGFEFSFPEWPQAALDLVERWRAKYLGGDD
ncbi:MAG TPA: DUF1731 domain-containing protein [Candidatus Limnocylindrales bacterium]|nr:DUF1731 domain-containing protein [Candidatus Limnocylindrales bacterium]